MNNITELPRAPLFGACSHRPPCPPATASNHDEAVVIASHHEQGFVLLCNHVIVFDDTGEILPDGRTVAAHRPEPAHKLAVA